MIAHLQHLFIPHHTNNHRSKLLHPSSLAVIIGLYLFAHTSLKLTAYYTNPISQGTVLGYASNISTADVIAQVNQERLNNGQASLIENAQLSAAAQSKAQDMFASNYWAHNNPQNGRQPWNFIREAGYSYRYAGENLARDFGDTLSLVAAWMASPTHRENIVSDRYRETGVAVVNGQLQGVETTLVVQMFGAKSGQQTVSAARSEAKIPSIVEGPPPSKDTIVPIQVAQATSEVAPSSDTNPLLTPIAISKSLALSILLVLGVTLVIDYFIITRRRIIRVTGKNLAHLGFFAAIAFIVIIIQAGSIL